MPQTESRPRTCQCVCDPEGRPQGRPQVPWQRMPPHLRRQEAQGLLPGGSRNCPHCPLGVRGQLLLRTNSPGPPRQKHGQRGPGLLTSGTCHVPSRPCLWRGHEPSTRAAPGRRAGGGGSRRRMRRESGAPRSGRLQPLLPAPPRTRAAPCPPVPGSELAAAAVAGREPPRGERSPSPQPRRDRRRGEATGPMPRSAESSVPGRTQV